MTSNALDAVTRLRGIDAERVSASRRYREEQVRGDAETNVPRDVA